MKFVDRTARWIGVAVFGGLAFYLSYNAFPDFLADQLSPLQKASIFGILGVFLGFILVPFLFIRPIRNLRIKLENESALQVSANAIGLLLGLTAGALASVPLSLLPSPFSRFLPLIAGVLFGYLGVRVVLAKKEWLRIFIPEKARTEVRAEEIEIPAKKVILDTSVIIDGRIAEIAKTGFIPGTMIVPTCILKELQYIADSEDSLKRQRGRRGLEILCKLQKEQSENLSIYDFNPDEVKDSESKLILLAKQLDSKIITNDYNLNRVADLQGVSILNINDLANAVKSVILPGETLLIFVIQEGKEFNQGVGYIEDGTMVVIENGRLYMNQEISVVVTKILQTAVGRMIFARPE